MQTVVLHLNKEQDMKKILFLFISVLSIITLYSCDDRDDIRKDIDNLNSRLDELQPLIKQMNKDLISYQGILDGSVFIKDYSINDYGDYTITFSDGNSMTIYSGVLEEEVPVLTIGGDGWYYTQNDETYPLVGTDGKQVPAFGEDGSTPMIRINKSGMWEYSFDGGMTWLAGFGTALPKNGISIFDEVIPSKDGNSLIFKWHTGEELHEAEVALFGLDLTIDFGEESLPVTFKPNTTKQFLVKQTGVAKAMIETNDWLVKLDENRLYITAPTVSGENKILIKIFSKTGYCKLITIPVKVQ